MSPSTRGSWKRHEPAANLRVNYSSVQQLGAEQYGVFALGKGGPGRYYTGFTEDSAKNCAPKDGKLYNCRRRARRKGRPRERK